jgi:hypothetical protein
MYYPDQQMHNIYINNSLYIVSTATYWGARWRSVKALRYKPAGRGFDSRWCHWNFSLT